MDEATDELSPADKWARPVAPLLDTRKQGLAFQQMELDSYIDKPMPGMPGPTALPLPTWFLLVKRRRCISLCDDCARRRTQTVFFFLNIPFLYRTSQQPSADHADVRHHYGGPQRPVSCGVASIHTADCHLQARHLSHDPPLPLNNAAPMSTDMHRTFTAQRRRGLPRIM